MKCYIYFKGGADLREVKDVEVRKSEIIAAAKNLFYTKGYAKTTTQDIVDALKISRGLLYYHFSSKEDILFWIVERQVEPMLAKFRSITYNEKLSAKDKLTLLIDSTVNSESPVDPKDYLLQDVIQSPENALLVDNISHKLAYSMFDYFNHILRQGNEEGIFYVQYPEELSAFLITGFSFVMNDSFFHNNDNKISTRYFVAFKHLLNQTLGSKKPLFEVEVEV